MQLVQEVALDKLLMNGIKRIISVIETDIQIDRLVLKWCIGEGTISVGMDYSQLGRHPLIDKIFSNLMILHTGCTNYHHLRFFLIESCYTKTSDLTCKSQVHMRSVLLLYLDICGQQDTPDRNTKNQQSR